MKTEGTYTRLLQTRVLHVPAKVPGVLSLWLHCIASQHQKGKCFSIWLSGDSQKCFAFPEFKTPKIIVLQQIIINTWFLY